MVGRSGPGSPCYETWLEQLVTAWLCHRESPHDSTLALWWGWSHGLHLMLCKAQRVSLFYLILACSSCSRTTFCFSPAALELLHDPKGSVVCSKGIISVWQQTQEAVSERENKGMSCPGPVFLPLQVWVVTKSKAISTCMFQAFSELEESLVYSMAMPMQVFQFVSLSVQKGLPVPNYSSVISEC